MADSQARQRERQWLLTGASLVVIVGGLKLAAPVILPVLMAMLLAVVAIPPIRWLQRRGLPASAAVAAIAVGAALALLFVLGVVGSSVHRFSENLPHYRERLDAVIADALSLLERLGADVSPAELSAAIDTGQIMDMVGKTAGAALQLLSNLLLVVLIVIFMLLEAHGFSSKLRLALGDPDADLAEWTRAADRVYQYLFLKSLNSAATGVCASLLTWAAGVPFPLLWGLVAFMFNFVPNVGSIIAAVPAVLLALLDNGVVNAAIVGGGYLAINLIIETVIEPRFVGERLGLSSLVVVLSLGFWGWLWGPVGMLLSVPLTVIVKIALEHTEQFRGVAVLLGPAPTARRPASGASDPPAPTAA